MEKDNKVSIWVGKTNTENDFRKYLKENYTDEGDFSSVFMKEFGIDYYNNQFMEVLYKDIDDNSKTALFKDFSYSENFTKHIPDENWILVNSFVLLYNFEYDNSLLKKSNTLKFLGTYSYI